MSETTVWTCSHCGGLLDGRRRRWCGEICRKKAAYAARRVLPAPNVCRECGDTFQPGRTDCRFCSALCRSRYYGQRWSERKRREAAAEALALDAARAAEREADEAARAARLVRMGMDTDLE